MTSTTAHDQLTRQIRREVGAQASALAVLVGPRPTGPVNVTPV